MSFFPTRRIASLLVLVVLGCSMAAAEEKAESIASVAVKLLERRTPAADPSGDMPATSIAPTPPPATLPAERLPQYRIGYQRADATLQAQVHDGTVRFLLTTPAILEQIGRPLLCETTILIDGQPFSTVREQMAAGLLAASTQPEVPAQTEQESTSDPAAETPEDADSEAATDAEQPQNEPVSPATEPAYSLASDPEELMRRYAQAVGESLDEAEAGWLLTHWSAGPTLLVLHPYHQSFRADQRPVFTLLDSDRDGVLSATELDEADPAFRRCDVNRDDIVDVLEISQAADGLRDQREPNAAAGPLFWLLSDLAGVSEQDSQLYGAVAAFDSNQNGQIEAAEIESLAAQTPDIRLTVAFLSESAESSKLHVTGVNHAQHVTAQADRLGHGVEVSIGAMTIHLSAVQESVLEHHSGQIAIGAVVDGYPLLPELDPNDDGRFTIRERRTLPERLRAKDRDNDQALSRQECLSPIRVCFGLGPLVHRELADVRATAPPAIPEAISGPEWFFRMDRNQDNDLTRGEFPGTDEQFAALDTDGDSLVSAGEANDFEKQSER